MSTTSIRTAEPTAPTEPRETAEPGASTWKPAGSGPVEPSVGGGLLARLVASYADDRMDRVRPRDDLAPHRRYLLALLDPDACAALHHVPARDSAGLVLHFDQVWECNVAWISEAERIVTEDCDYRVHAVEHRDHDTWYWTFDPTPTRRPPDAAEPASGEPGTVTPDSTTPDSTTFDSVEPGSAEPGGAEPASLVLAVPGGREPGRPGREDGR